VDYSQSPERVIWAGHVPDEDLPGLYAGALLFVYPSMYEGFGLPALESMACGCPVICSNTGALPEVCGDAAMFINPLSSHELARALRQLITSRSSQEQLKLSGIQQSKKFYWQKTAQQTLNILKNFSFP
jgi:glycosyltransferase involved in cell wall biosynthesis